eukprot:GHVQ01026396.1.p1 GENE.GHVQ01026396.1~~GHVQ01026396.1.p1  ORF type:complete len:849 (-),score=137.50 GHVQ01026396.1:128-2674(-)
MSELMSFSSSCGLNTTLSASPPVSSLLPPIAKQQRPSPGGKDFDDFFDSVETQIERERKRPANEIAVPNIGDTVQTKAAHRDAQIFVGEVKERWETDHGWLFRIKSKELSTPYTEPLKNVRLGTAWTDAEALDLAKGRRRPRHHNATHRLLTPPSSSSSSSDPLLQSYTHTSYRPPHEAHPEIFPAPPLHESVLSSSAPPSPYARSSFPPSPSLPPHPPPIPPTTQPLTPINPSQDPRLTVPINTPLLTQSSVHLVTITSPPTNSIPILSINPNSLQAMPLSTSYILDQSQQTPHPKQHRTCPTSDQSTPLSTPPIDKQQSPPLCINPRITKPISSHSLTIPTSSIHTLPTPPPLSTFLSTQLYIVQLTTADVTDSFMSNTLQQYFKVTLTPPCAPLPASVVGAVCDNPLDLLPLTHLFPSPDIPSSPTDLAAKLSPLTSLMAPSICIDYSCWCSKHCPACFGVLHSRVCSSACAMLTCLQSGLLLVARSYLSKCIERNKWQQLTNKQYTAYSDSLPPSTPTWFSDSLSSGCVSRFNSRILPFLNKHKQLLTHQRKVLPLSLPLSLSLPSSIAHSRLRVVLLFSVHLHPTHCSYPLAPSFLSNIDINARTIPTHMPSTMMDWCIRSGCSLEGLVFLIRNPSAVLASEHRDNLLTSSQVTTLQQLKTASHSEEHIRGGGNWTAGVMQDNDSDGEREADRETTPNAKRRKSVSNSKSSNGKGCKTKEERNVPPRERTNVEELPINERNGKDKIYVSSWKVIYRITQKEKDQGCGTAKDQSENTREKRCQDNGWYYEAIEAEKESLEVLRSRVADNGITAVAVDNDCRGVLGTHISCLTVHQLFSVMRQVS